jgi:Lysozyme inhibitor LprI
MHAMSVVMNRVAGALFVLAALSCIASAKDASDARGLREQCSAESQAGMRDCLAQHVQASASKLSQAEAQARRQIDQWDEDAKYRAQAKALLDTARKSFTRYRSAHCAFSAALGGGAIGNALEMRRLACQAELNEQRAAQLISGAAELADK